MTSHGSGGSGLASCLTYLWWLIPLVVETLSPSLLQVLHPHSLSFAVNLLEHLTLMLLQLVVQPLLLHVLVTGEFILHPNLLGFPLPLRPFPLLLLPFCLLLGLDGRLRGGEIPAGQRDAGCWVSAGEVCHHHALLVVVGVFAAVATGAVAFVVPEGAGHVTGCYGVGVGGDVLGGHDVG